MRPDGGTTVPSPRAAIASPACSIVFAPRSLEATAIINFAHHGHSRNNDVPAVSPGL
jgi:hypothetical protein